MVYGANGELTQMVYANGTMANYTYDPNRLWLKSTSVTSNGTPLYTASYTYDSLQRVTSMTQGTPTPKTTTYTYDDLNRLLGVDGGQTQRFAYDSVGNITSNSSVGAYAYGDPAHKHAVTSAGAANYTYDALGSMLSGSLYKLNTDLVNKPRECLEYIVVHEMIHLLGPTRNAWFIALMDRFMPRWQFCREVLNRLPVRHEEWGC